MRITPKGVVLIFDVLLTENQKYYNQKAMRASKMNHLII